MFHLALVAQGVSTAEDALALWQNIAPNQAPSVRATWLRAAVKLVMRRRQQTRKLARSYYRLIRALHTGTTTKDPDKPSQEYTTIRELRDEFNAEATAASSQVEPLPPSDDDDLDRILLEEIAQLDAEEKRVEAEAEAEAQRELSRLGPGVLDRKLKEIDTSQPASEVDKERQQAQDQAGAQQAASAVLGAQNGARSELWTYIENDKAVVGYVRLSRTGTPCGWCAMLISRGPVYRSEKAATFKGGAATFDDGDKYHPNCQCYALPIFSSEDFDSSSLFALNRQYAEEWPRVTRGLSGKQAVSAWRRYIRQTEALSR